MIECAYIVVVLAEPLADIHWQAQNVINIINRANYDETGGMMPIGWNTTDGTPHDRELELVCVDALNLTGIQTVYPRVLRRTARTSIS